MPKDCCQRCQVDARLSHSRCESVAEIVQDEIELDSCLLCFFAEIVVRVVQARDVPSGVAIRWKYPRRVPGHPGRELSAHSQM